jgi:hypothetical protein
MPSKMKRTARVQDNVTTVQPSDHDIRYRAYEIYVARGEESGRELDDWLQAERELGGVAVASAAVRQNEQ